MSIIRTEPVTDENDIRILAEIFDRSLSTDPFYQILLSQYPPGDAKARAIEANVGHLRAGLQSPGGHLFKAVHIRHDVQGNVVEEKIIGFSQWFVGYIDLPKQEPVTTSGKLKEKAEPISEREQVSNVVETTEMVAEPVESKVEPGSPEQDSHFDFYKRVVLPHVNAYIENIRGKKHVCE
jgi:hypothetical protein